MSTENLRFENIDDITVEKALTEARKEGVFAGLTGGLASGISSHCAARSRLKLLPAVIGGRLLKFNRNTTLFCGVLSGVLSGYYFAEAFRNTAIAQLRAEDARLSASRSQNA
ncbi:hypothetical protein NMY22_g16739 [Coprinellus aureogranulatus]|nr:hypothetical protein NMY22_g16739 [Coprinellus aureogranulatus]